MTGRARIAVLLPWLILLACSLPAAPSQVGEASPAPPVSPSPSPVPPPPLVFSTERALEHVRVLSAEIGPRPAGSAADAAAFEYIHGVLTAGGLEVSVHTFPLPQGGESRNLSARLPGADYEGGYLIVGGHYDTVPESPGANDNASGTGVVLALAEAFGGRRVPVEFVAFGAEERQPGAGIAVGSDAFVQARQDLDRVSAMVSVDMIGNGPAVLLYRVRGESDALQREFAEVASAAGIPHRPRDGGEISDHAPFARRGIPAVLLYTGSHPTFHKPTDTFEVVQPEAVARAGELVLAWLKSRFGVE